MIGNLTYDETWVVSSIKKLDECLFTCTEGSRLMLLLGPERNSH